MSAIATHVGATFGPGHLEQTPFDPARWLAPSASGGAPVRRGDVYDVLRAVRELLPKRRARHWLISGGESPELVQALAREIGSRDERLVLIPPRRDALPDDDALRLALVECGGADAVLVLGSCAASGLVPPFESIDALCRDARVPIVLDVSLGARVDQGLPAIGAVVGVLADRTARGEWSFAASACPGRSPSASRAKIEALDAWCEHALAQAPGVRLAETPGVRRAEGLLAVALDGWSAREAAALLEESFGVEVEAAPLTAVPLPCEPDGSRPDWMRITLSESHETDDIDWLVRGVSQIAAAGSAPARSH